MIEMMMISRRLWKTLDFSANREERMSKGELPISKLDPQFSK